MYKNFYAIALFVISIFVIGSNISRCKRQNNFPAGKNLALPEKQDVEKTQLSKATVAKKNYKTELNTLEHKRIGTTEKLCYAQLAKKEKEKDIVTLEHEIEYNFTSHIEQIRQKNLADYRTKYGNENKRKIELQEEKNNNKKLQKLFKEKDKLEKELHKLICQESIDKIQEKYLFKKIDLDSSLRDLEIAKINAGLSVK